MKYLVLGLALAFIGCSSSDEDTGKTSTDGGAGSGGSGGGSGGSTTGGTGGSTGGTAGASTGGSAGSATGGSAGASGDCPTDIGAAVGQPCTEEGKTCGNCSDPCQFCNIIRCESGQWEPMEVFPAPCDGGTD
jgi:hypothetical protein